MKQPTAQDLRDLPRSSTVRTVGGTYWCKTGPDTWHRTMEARGRGRSSRWVSAHAKIVTVERTDVEMFRLLGYALRVFGGQG